MKKNMLLQPKYNLNLEETNLEKELKISKNKKMMKIIIHDYYKKNLSLMVIIFLLNERYKINNI